MTSYFNLGLLGQLELLGKCLLINFNFLNLVLIVVIRTILYLKVYFSLIINRCNLHWLAFMIR